MLERANREISNSTAPGYDGAQHVLLRDYETRGVLALNKVGVHRYAADSRTTVLCCAYVVDNEPVKLWTPGDAIPPEFYEAAKNPNWLAVAHNAHFEMAIEQHILGPRFGWPLIPLEQQRCTMAMALALSLPAKLDAVARALELRHQKDAVGHRLMLMMSKPRKPHKDEDPKQLYWFEDQDRLGRLYEYSQADAESERELFARLPPLSPSEQALWILDAKINQRGFRSIAAWRKLHARSPKPLGRRSIASSLPLPVALLPPSIRSPNCKHGWSRMAVLLKTCRKKPWRSCSKTPSCLRKYSARSSSAKMAVRPPSRRSRRSYNVPVMMAVSAARLQFHKASTGRWAGEGFQPQNLKRPQEEDLEAAIAAVATGDYEHVRGLYPRALSLLGDLGRSLIVAAPGHTLIGADFSAIESRVLAWVGNEQWKLDVYSRYDATQDPRDEPYCILACRMLHVPDGSFTSELPERKIGKTADLACGYMGGAGAIEKFAPGVFDEAKREQIKTEWRAAHPNVVNFWYEIDRAAWAAVQNRGSVVRCGPVAFRCVGAFLFLKLPSGRKLAYPVARTKLIDPQRGVVLFTDNAAGRWRDCRDGRGAFGGTWVENVVQAISRDLLAEAMLRIEAAGYSIVLHVHDEIVAEVPEGFGSTEEFTRIMTRAPSWALTLPIAAKAWAGPRFG